MGAQRVLGGVGDGWEGADRAALTRADGTVHRSGPGPAGVVYRREAPAQHLVEVARGAPNRADGELGLRTVELVEAAYRSATERRTLPVTDLYPDAPAHPGV